MVVHHESDEPKSTFSYKRKGSSCTQMERENTRKTQMCSHGETACRRKPSEA